MCIGKGEYAHVYTKEKSCRVIRLFFRRDFGYETYMKFITENPENQYVPKIYCVLIGDDFKAVVLEKLEPLKRDEYPCNDWFEHFLYLPSDYNRFNYGFAKHELSEKEEDIKDFLISAVQENKDKKNRFCLATDVYSHNIMKRSCGQLVITDPLSHY